MRYTLRQLEVFLATARTENITRAAESLAMSQSAASGALKELEQQFDVALFDRAGKRLKLNELGRVLLPRAQGLLEQAGELDVGDAVLVERVRLEQRAPPRPGPLRPPAARCSPPRSSPPGPRRAPRGR